MLDYAAVDQKGKNYFTSKIVCATTNTNITHDLKANIIAPNALRRRFELVVDVISAPIRDWQNPKDYVLRWSRWNYDKADPKHSYIGQGDFTAFAKYFNQYLNDCMAKAVNHQQLLAKYSAPSSTDAQSMFGIDFDKEVLPFDLADLDTDITQRMARGESDFDESDDEIKVAAQELEASTTTVTESALTATSRPHELLKSEDPLVRMGFDGPKFNPSGKWCGLLPVWARLLVIITGFLTFAAAATGVFYAAKHIKGYLEDTKQEIADTSKAFVQDIIAQATPTEEQHSLKHYPGQPLSAKAVKQSRPVHGKFSQVQRLSNVQQHSSFMNDPQTDECITHVIAPNLVQIRVCHENAPTDILVGLFIKKRILQTTMHILSSIKSTGFTHLELIHRSRGTISIPRDDLDFITCAEKDVIYFNVHQSTENKCDEFKDITHHFLSDNDARDGITLGVSLVYADDHGKEHDIQSNNVRMRDEITYPFEGTNESFVIKNVLSAFMSTQRGMSGSPFLLRNRKYSRKILGIHTAGSTYHGFCALLTAEEVQAQCDKFENSPRPVDSPPVGNMKHESWVPQGCRLVQVVAKSESPRMADTSNIIKSPIHGIFPSTKKPAHLKPDATHSPFKMAVHEYFQPHAKTQPQDKKDS